jgi:hypothetical protein
MDGSANCHVFGREVLTISSRFLSEHETVISQIARVVFTGRVGWFLHPAGHHRRYFGTAANTCSRIPRWRPCSYAIDICPANSPA